MNVFYVASRNLYEHLLPPVRSLLDHHSDARIFLLVEDDKVPGMPDNCICINCSDQHWFGPGCPNIKTVFSYICLMRACVDKLLPDDMDRVIQLDADTIITDSLDDMWNIDLTDKWIAACPENENHTQFAYEAFSDKYYNVGTAVLNLKQIRADNIMERMRVYLNTAKLPWIDQDAWNYFGLRYKKIIDLDVRFNESKMTGITDSPAIVHYCAVSKWWDGHKYDRCEFWEKYAGNIAPLVEQKL